MTASSWMKQHPRSVPPGRMAGLSGGSWTPLWWSWMIPEPENRQSIKIGENWCHMVARICQMCQCILDSIQFVKLRFWHSGKHRIAVVEPRAKNGTGDHLCCFGGHRRTCMAEDSHMEETTLIDCTEESINCMFSKTTSRLLTRCDRLIGVPATLIKTTLWSDLVLVRQPTPTCLDLEPDNYETTIHS